MTYPFLFHWNRPGLPGKKGQPCRLLIRSRKMNSCAIEFEDLTRAVVSRNALRKRKPGECPRPNSI